MVELDPHTAVWETTLACNSNCLHCGSDAKTVRPNELTTAEAFDLVDQLADLDFKLIIESGGEPLLRKDWFEISQRIQEKDMGLGIISNGLNWKKGTIDKLVELQPYSIGFSIDGEPRLHDYLRGVPGSHKKVFQQIKQIKKEDLTICAITAVNNNNNLKQLGKIRDRISTYNIDAWQIQMASPMGRMSKNQNLLLDENEYYKLGEFIAETRKLLPRVNVQAGDCIGYFGDLGPKVYDDEWGGCIAGINGLGIESDGTIKGCLSIQSDLAKEGNIRDESLKTIWSDPTRFKYTRNFKVSDLKGNCFDCYRGAECKGGCSSQSMSFFNEFHHAPYCFTIHEARGKNV
ncbi:radical SAM protein [Candidatus Woesearchaeota archaeon]|jgi:radical SAM protein with 4Fe4S-binding SPASM domain|nr:radical SAM protein [Candidatus Woesearchaeota archaeon]